MSPESEITVLTISNAIELTTSIVAEVSGGVIAETINGSHAGRETIDALVVSRMNQLCVRAVSSGDIK